MCLLLSGIPVKPVESAAGTKPSLLISHPVATTERFPKTSPIHVTSGTESSGTDVTVKITMKANTTLAGTNMSAQSVTDLYSLEDTTYSSYSFSSTVENSDVPHSTASPSVLSRLISSTNFPAAFQTSSITSYTVNSNASTTSPLPIAASTTLLSRIPLPTHSILLTPNSLVVFPFPLEVSTTQQGTLPSTSTL